MTIREVSVSWTIPRSCHRMKTSILEWVGRVPWSTKWSPDMSVFVVFAKPPLRLRAAIFRAACQAKKVRGCSSVTEAMTLNSAVFFLLQFLQMNCCSNDAVQGKKRLNRTVKLSDKKEHRNVYSHFVEYLTLQSVNWAGWTKLKEMNEVNVKKKYLAG